MSDPPRGIPPSLQALLDENDPEQQRQRRLARREAQMEASLLIFECYGKVVTLVDGDHAFAGGLFEVMAKVSRKFIIPRKGRGQSKKNIERNPRLVAARSRAPRRQLKNAAESESDARQGRHLTAPQRELQRKGEKILNDSMEALLSGDQAAKWEACEQLFKDLPPLMRVGFKFPDE